LSSFIMFGVAC